MSSRLWNIGILLTDRTIMPYWNLILPLSSLFYRMWRHFSLDDLDTQKVPGVAECSPPPLDLKLQNDIWVKGMEFIFAVGFSTEWFSILANWKIALAVLVFSVNHSRLIQSSVIPYAIFIIDWEEPLLPRGLKCPKFSAMTLLRHLGRAQKRKTNLRSHDLKNIGKETSIYKSEGNFSHTRKLLITCVI